jgi:hypothetical protein
MTQTHQQYLDFAHSLDPNRFYTLVETGDLQRQGGDFDRSVVDQLHRDLGSHTTPALERRYVSEAEKMTRQSPGEAATEIFRLPDGKEAVMVYPAAHPTTAEYLTLFTGYSPDALNRLGFSQSLGKNDLNNLEDMARWHEIGHATDPTRTQENTRDYSPGMEGLYDANRAETRADIIAVMQSIRNTGSTHTAQLFADMRTLRTFTHGADQGENGIVYPELEHYTVPTIQYLIDNAAKNNNYQNMNPAEMGAYADQLAKSENDRLRSGHMLERLGDRLRQWDDQLTRYPKEGRFAAAVRLGLENPQGQGFYAELMRAHEDLSGGRINAGSFAKQNFSSAPDAGRQFADAGSPIPKPGRSPAPAPRAVDTGQDINGLPVMNGQATYDPSLVTGPKR